MKTVLITDITSEDQDKLTRYLSDKGYGVKDATKGKTALITGITGQDGAYLAKLLLEKGYTVYGTFRRISTPNFWRLQQLGIINDVKLVSSDLLDQSSILTVLKQVQPDEVYNLAAQSFVGASFEQPIATGEITGLGLTRILDTIKSVNPKIKFYQASSSEMFGMVQETPQTEKTPFYPRSPYAAAKLYAHWVTVNYRESYNMFACCGILFNHESPLRGLEFITRKVTNALARVKLGLQTHLEVGNLDARRDWGYSPDYVEAMWLMLQQDTPDDYVISTGETHTVREFIDVVCSELGINITWEGKGVNEVGKDETGRVIIRVNPAYFRPSEVDILLGSPKKAFEKMGWKPKVTFRELVKIMAQEDLDRWERYLRGERFSWDAANDISWEVKAPGTYKLDR
jgi:GDPmannose 4,6-dehydratase